MTKLNQIVAIEKGVKSKTHGELTQAYHVLQKPGLLSGIARTYKPLDELGEQFPAESTKVQVRAQEVIKNTETILTKLFDVTATKEWANTRARSTVIVDGKTLLENVPITYLLFLEKQLIDLDTIIRKLPTLDPSESWSFDEGQDCFATSEQQTHKTKKVPKNHVKAPATDKHPAQVEMYYEDQVVGYWTTRKYSGAFPQKRVNDMLERLHKLQEAVKFAREEANAIQVEDVKVGKTVFDYLFGK